MTTDRTRPSDQLALLVSPADVARIDEAREPDGLSRSAYFRARLMRWLREGAMLEANGGGRRVITGEGQQVNTYVPPAIADQVREIAQDRDVPISVVLAAALGV